MTAITTLMDPISPISVVPEPSKKAAKRKADAAWGAVPVEELRKRMEKMRPIMETWSVKTELMSAALDVADHLRDIHEFFQRVTQPKLTTPSASEFSFRQLSQKKVE